MLVAIETYFLKALQTAFPSGVLLTSGPAAVPSDANTPTLEVVASQFTFIPEKPAEGDTEAPARSPAFEFRMQFFPADGIVRDFVLPAEAKGDIVEVQAPPGRLLTRGDEYQVDDRTIRFYRPPAQLAPGVVVRLRGNRVRGYQQRFAGQADLFVRIWSRDRAKTDELSRSVLSTVLIAAENLGVLEAVDAKNPNITLRMLRARAAVPILRRGFEATFYTATVEIVLRGELEQCVALGAAEEEGIIREVRKA